MCNTCTHADISHSINSIAEPYTLSLKSLFKEQDSETYHTSYNNANSSDIPLNDQNSSNNKTCVSENIDSLRESPQMSSRTINNSNDLSSFGLIRKGLRIGNLNICHLIPKLDEIRLLLNEHRSVNILGLCETFLNENTDDNVLSIDGFTFERRDRDDGRSGGGILVYVSNQISYKRRSDLETKNGPETIWLEIINPSSKSIFVCSAYRPPSAPNSWVDGLANEIRKATSCVDTEVLLFGDFNINYAIEPPQFWVNALEEFNMSQVITTPTRVTDKSCTLLDHVYTNKPENICEINVPIIALSDHYPVCITRRFNKSAIKKRKHIEIQYRDFKNFDENLFLNDLLEVNLDDLEQISDPTEINNMFYSLMFGVLNKQVKTKTKRVKSQLKPSWISPEINDARHMRDFYHKKKDTENFKLWRNKVTDLIRSAKEQYYQSAIDENKTSKDIWKYIKELGVKSKDSTPTMLSVNGQTVNEDGDMANMFNDFFIDLSRSLLSENTEYSNTLHILKNFTQAKLRPSDEFCIRPIDETSVFSMLTKLNVNKSAGIDSLGPRLLKLSAPIISKCVAHMINRSIDSGFFPDELKVAKVTPIFKKGDRSDPGNYRPISILPTISKLYERHVASQIYEYLSTFNLLHVEQSGFRQFHSCQTALTKLIDTWLKEMDEGNVIGVSFLDFRKAFDLVNHNILIDKLKYYNFNNSAIEWISSYLSNRHQSVHIGNARSSRRTITCGVPQGSVLGPLLFLIYINDLPLHVQHSKLSLFADDATLHKSATSMESINLHISSDVDNVNSWCRENAMIINEAKSKCMMIGTSQRLSKLQSRTLNVNVNDQTLDNVDNEKLLGVHLDSHLQFNKHVDVVCRSITSKIALLKRIKRYLPLSYRTLYYNAYVLPCIDYCLTIWGNTSKTNLERIHKLQKCAARVILDAPPDSPSLPLFNELGWLNVFERVELNKGVLLYKIVNGMCPDYLPEMFTFQTSESYGLRSSTQQKLCIPKHKNELFKRSLQYSGAIIWNDIPLQIRTASTLQTFKSNLFRHIVSKR